jgi:DNA-binding MarR family transcriptional regulator
MAKTGKSRSSDHAVLSARLDRAIRETSAQSALFSSAIAQRLGITINDIECLNIINLNGPMTAGKLAEVTGLTTGAITGIVDRLSAVDLVVREPDPNDRRRVIVRVKSEMPPRVSPFYRSIKRRLEEVCGEYSEKELLLLVQFYEKTLDALREETIALRGDGEAPR